MGLFSYLFDCKFPNSFEWEFPYLFDWEFPYHIVLKGHTIFNIITNEMVDAARM